MNQFQSIFFCLQLFFYMLTLPLLYTCRRRAVIFDITYQKDTNPVESESTLISSFISIISLEATPINTDTPKDADSTHEFVRT